MRMKSWNKSDLINAVNKSTSVRKVLFCLKLKAAGGNYSQINKFIKEYKINTAHFKGKAWNKGLTGMGKPLIPLRDILIKNSNYQSYKLKRRLFGVGLKKQECEECGWAKKAKDGRLPLELDHINGDSKDNRLSNLRVLCPNCHSLKETHRGRNRKKIVSPCGGIGRRAALKML